jgi:SAM-dependent methyltransferase
MHSATNSGFSTARVAIGWFRDSFRYRGFWGTMRQFAVRVFEFVRDLTPARRRLRYGDLQYDFDHGVNTTWSNIKVSTRFREIFSGEEYQPVDPEQFHRIIGSLGIPFENFTFIDLGSGKGRALLLASEYPFRRIIGVEILPELHVVAEENLRKFSSERQKCKRLEVWCGDARDYEFPLEPTLLYIFNPFFEPVLEQVLANLQRSLQEGPRELILVYANPVSHAIVDKATALRKVAGSFDHAVYVFEHEPVATPPREFGQSERHFPRSRI